MNHLTYHLCWAALVILAACGAPSAEASGSEATAPTKAARPTLTVATAANVQFAMEELIHEFQEQTGIGVSSVISSSGKLTAQIMEGAPYDILVSANMKYPQYLLEKDQAVGSVSVYAYGALVAWSMTEKNIRVTPEYLLEDGFTKIAIANPKNAPYGEQAINYLKYYGVFEGVEPMLVYGENIAQTNQYITSKAADVGLTAKSVVLSPEVKGQGRWLELPDSSYTPIEQGVVITRYGNERHARESLAFFTFLFSETAQKIFLKYGYKLPDQNATTQ
ncbi:molybdate ABC transporter substrate-binding protein [Phaeodactylibacter xiamenensis]|uniref:molybdate ABC transporter substrate-binding protein n=1 Tax=Phaeodactylibacter xiamenensis TaxID=1524460 RepID=UPI003BAC0C4B